MDLPSTDEERSKRSAELNGTTSAGARDPAGATDTADPPRGVGRPDEARPPASIQELQKQRWVERLEKAENQPSIRQDLKARLNHFEKGNPSSPWEEDGTPKPPVPLLSDLERPSPPLTDADYKAHVREVVNGMADAATADPPIGVEHSIDGKGHVWTPERNKIHAEMVNTAYSDSQDVPCEHTAVIAGGLGGAGKTTVLERYAGIDLSRFLMINPDDFKEDLAERGLIAEIPNLSPMETTGLYHEESSDVARRLGMTAMADGKNVIWDITMSSVDSTARRIRELKDAGYGKIIGIFVDIPVEVSLARSESRHRRGHDQYLAGNGLGGRYVPADLITGKTDQEFGTTNRRTFERLKGEFTDWMIYDNSIDGRAPILIERKTEEI